jgi:vesicle coat complex subunit
VYRVSDIVTIICRTVLINGIRWGQIAILTAIVNYTPRDSEDATNICERVIPRLQHVNGSVVLVAIRVSEL